VPLAVDFAKSEPDGQLIRAGIHDTQITRRLYVLPPGTPNDRLQLLRKAFMSTMQDSEFLKEAQKSKLDIDTVTGEETERIVKSLFNLDSAVIARLKEILS
jgi:tripartite-type tricarboxylate transporter receptor subunit TctC